MIEDKDDRTLVGNMFQAGNFEKSFINVKCMTYVAAVSSADVVASPVVFQADPLASALV